MCAATGHESGSDPRTVQLSPPPAAMRLRVFGAGPHAEQVYRLLLRSGPHDLESLADLVGRPLSQVEREVRRLLELRLVREADGKIRPEPPDLALGRLVTEHEERIQAEEQALSVVRAAIPQYVLDHASSQEGSWEPIRVDAIEVSDMVATMESLLRQSTGELRFMRPDQWSLPSGQRMDEYVIEAVSRGRMSRVLYPERIRADIPPPVQARADAGESVRLVPTVPFRLAIFGSDAAILPEHLDHTGGRRLVIRQPALVRALVDLFDLYWSRGVAIPGLGAPAVGDDTRQLIDMLAEGAKDEQMARALGVSLRTVRRRIAGLLAELGVQSRFQAGVEAMRRGWL